MIILKYRHVFVQRRPSVRALTHRSKVLAIFACDSETYLDCFKGA